jgi:hypothetical protein
MLVDKRTVRVGLGPAVLGCGVAGFLALTGCGSSSSSSTAGSTTSGAATPSSAATSASPGPSWATALGPGVTVIPPQAVAPGQDSPGAVTAAELSALNTKKVTSFCKYGLPAQAAKCASELSQVPASQFPFTRNAAIGYVAVQGNKAVVGMTGTFCTPGQKPECFTNTDPAAVFSTVHSFSGLWKNAMSSSPMSYSLTPCEKIGGKWYIYSSTS